MLELPRSSGIKLHPSSLPGRFGMGEIGPQAERWLELLERMGQRAWVMPATLPLAGFAGDSLSLSFDALRNDGVLLPSDLALLPAFNEERINPGPVSEVRHAFLQLAARRFLHQVEVSPLLAHAFDKFCDGEAGWLDDWSLHSALAHAHEGRSWYEWPHDLASRQPEALAEAMVQHAAEIEEQKVLQFLHARHWQRLRARAHDLGLMLVGTLPTFVTRESAAVWAMPHLFALDADGQATRLTRLEEGSEDACLSYRWEAHREDDFAWWRLRWATALRRFDAVILEQMKGLDAVWETDLEGQHGCWVHGPSNELLSVLGHLLTDSDANTGLTSLDQIDACTSTLAVCDWQSLLGAGSRESSTWRFTWEEVASDLELSVRSATAKAGRL